MMDPTTIDPAVLIGLGLVSAFAAVLLGGYVVATATQQRRQVRRSLRVLHATDAPDLRARELALPVLRRVVLPSLSRLATALLRVSPPAIVRRLDEELVRAGSPPGWDGQRLLAARWVVGAATGVMTAAVVAASMGSVRTTVIALVVAVIGSYVPEWMVRSRAGSRQAAIRRALPDALDLLSITVGAGLGFDAALDRVSRDLGGPLGEELHRVVQEMRLGTGRAQALRNLAARTTVDELRSFVLAMVQAEIFGISVTSVLQVQADELRTRRRQRAEQAAQKLPVKIVFPLILCIFPALLVILLGPAAVTIYDRILQR